jgi:hypothetical protein
MPSLHWPHWFCEDHIEGLDSSSLALIKHLNLTMKVMDCEESTMDDFTAELLLVLGYEMEQTVIHM